MDENLNQINNLSQFKRFIPYIVLAVLLSLSVAGWRFYESLFMERERHRFDMHVNETVKDIAERLDKYEKVLRGGAGLFVASQEVTRDEWRDYYDYWQLSTDYPGIQRVAFSRFIRAQELDQHIEKIRAEGFPGYTVWPEGEREEYVPVVFLEPFDEPGRRVLGFDLFSENLRRSAMERARDTGGAAITEKLELVSRANKNHPGFLMFIPLYKQISQPHSIEARRATIKGYVMAAFNMHDLMLGIFADIIKINFDIYDGTEITPETRMFDSHVFLDIPADEHQAMFTSHNVLDLYGHQWTLVFKSLPAFEATVDRYTPTGILVAGLLITFLVFLFLMMLQKTGNKALLLAQKLQKAKAEAEEANRAKSDFLSVMSHEIRTPMNGVIGMLDVLSQSSLKAHQMEMVDIMRESAQSLLGIINNILDFSKIEAGKLEPEFSSMSICEVVDGVCKMLDRIATRKNVELLQFTDPDLPDRVLGDETRVRQVLINLVNNAVKFSSGLDRHGQVRVRANLINNGQGKIEVEFQVRDNGMGMDEQTKSRIFKPFIQADYSTTRSRGGTGLGLAISRGLVEMMHGKIILESSPDQGSTFIVRLPFEPLPDKSDKGLIDLSGLSCLVVGGPESIAGDLTAYLNHQKDIKTVLQVKDPAGIETKINSLEPGLWIWIVDAGREPVQVEELRALAGSRPDLDVRFVLVGRGLLRMPNKEEKDLVFLDAVVMSRYTFLQAVGIAAGRISPYEPDALPQKDKTQIAPMSREDALKLGSLILVAEDNETNQKVVLQQLQLLGYTADIGANGREALRLWTENRYALILCDLHMPEMDGLDLTRAIRAEEKDRDRVPIVAFTANVAKEEIKRCYEAGMDDHLGKPVRLESLQSMLKKWLPETSRTLPDAPETSEKETDVPELVDLDILKELVGNDPDILLDFIQDFRRTAQNTAEELRSACSRKDATAAGDAAHKLKSSARTVGALELGKLCAQMEQAGKNGEPEELTRLFPLFENEMHRVDSFLAESTGKLETSD